MKILLEHFEIKTLILKYGITFSSFLKFGALTLTGFSFIYCCKVWYAQRLFKRIGLKTPEFRFFVGNFPEILENTQAESMRQWTKKYGKTYGYYEGHLPMIVTSDLEIIQEVFIKQFGNFVARKIYPFQFSDDSPNMDIFLSSNKRWKRMRNIINPTFSPIKIKQLLPIMSKCSTRFIDVLEENTEKELIISDYLNRFTMDTIWNCAVGIDIDCQHNLNDPYLAKSLLVFKDLENLKFAFIVTTYLSEFRPILLKLLSLSTYVMSKIHDSFTDPYFWLTHHIHKIFENRQKNKIVRRDFAQLLIESQDDYVEVETSCDKIQVDKMSFEKKMSFDEIEFNLVGFLLAGFETTSTALNYCFYILSTHCDEQHKLQEEIDSFFKTNNAQPDLDNINQLQYLDLFIKETLRMYPIASNTVNRRCMYPTTVKGIKIPAGVSFTVDMLSLHYDEEYWGPIDPYKFYPLRFSSEYKRSQYAYLPFGIGPKNCVGMRFALLEMKLTLVKLLLKYNVKNTKNTPIELSFVEGTVRRPKNKIPICLEKRKNVYQL